MTPDTGVTEPGILRRMRKRFELVCIRFLCFYAEIIIYMHKKMGDLMQIKVDFLHKRI